MKKLTAVEWQFDELQIAEKDYKNEVIDGWEYAKRKYFILKQAHKLFEEQIIEACNYGIKLYINDPITGQDYYDATFKQKES